VDRQRNDKTFGVASSTQDFQDEDVLESQTLAEVQRTFYISPDDQFRTTWDIFQAGCALVHYEQTVRELVSGPDSVHHEQTVRKVVWGYSAGSPGALRGYWRGTERVQRGC